MSSAVIPKWSITISFTASGKSILMAYEPSYTKLNSVRQTTHSNLAYFVRFGTKVSQKPGIYSFNLSTTYTAHSIGSHIQFICIEKLITIQCHKAGHALVTTLLTPCFTCSFPPFIMPLKIDLRQKRGALFGITRHACTATLQSPLTLPSDISLRWGKTLSSLDRMSESSSFLNFLAISP